MTARPPLVVFARFGVRAEGQAHAGKRIVTGAAGVGASVGRLQWARGLHVGGPGWVRGWGVDTTWQLAKVGGLQALKWARANGCEWSAYTCYAAAGGGHLEVLQWARANGYEWDAFTCKTAAAGGIWSCCSGRGRTAANGMKAPDLVRQREGIWRCCSGRGRTAASGAAEITWAIARLTRK
eukprot:COSAG05_NODE_296_length_11959_cov_17.897639_7_plen_181_part_00